METLSIIIVIIIIIIIIIVIVIVIIIVVVFIVFTQLTAHLSYNFKDLKKATLNANTSPCYFH